ncbi:putative photosystem I [Medicago truncatula]|uniref:Putative photosystem I n=1 Tax=Medicago truncatula TaxID=3880 RepID=A0A396GZP6_MEDTR|nr:putative photosystem I [Medicago truncatula]
MNALGRPQDMFSDTAIQLQSVFAQWIKNTHALAPGTTAPGATTSTSLTWGGGDLVAVGGKVALLPIPLGTADFLVHKIFLRSTLHRKFLWSTTHKNYYKLACLFSYVVNHTK